MNPNGFLQRAPHGLRLSASQRRGVQRAMDSVFHHAKQQRSGGSAGESAALLDLCKMVVARVIASYPEDRSCNSCLNYDPSDGHCSSWKATVPTDAREAGCDRYLEDVPF